MASEQASGPEVSFPARNGAGGRERKGCIADREPGRPKPSRAFAVLALMAKSSVRLILSFLLAALTGAAFVGCGSDQTGTSNTALSTCDGGDACAAAPAQGGW